MFTKLRTIRRAFNLSFNQISKSLPGIFESLIHGSSFLIDTCPSTKGKQRAPESCLSSYQGANMADFFNRCFRNTPDLINYSNTAPNSASLITLLFPFHSSNITYELTPIDHVRIFLSIIARHSSPSGVPVRSILAASSNEFRNYSRI